jgi:hypothetical protein
MKTLLMTGALAMLFLPVVGFAAPPAQAPAQAPNKAVQAPTQAPVQAPNKTAQAAQPNAGYRTYSYMPSTTPNYNYNNNYNNYNYRNNGRPAFFSGHQPADYKVRGEYWAR